MQIKPNGQTPRDADGHPDLTGNWGAGFPNPIGQPGLRRPGGFEADQSAMQRGAQWNKPLYKPEYWEKVRSLDYGKRTSIPRTAVISLSVCRVRMCPAASFRRTVRSGC
jgi:hypothetical protein